MVRKFGPLMLASVILVAVPAGAEAPPPAVRYLAPAPGSAIAGGKVFLIGRLVKDHAKAELSLNGKPIPGLKMQGSAFSAEFQPAPGQNLVEARERGAVLGSLKFSFGPKGSGPAYRFHQALPDGNCAKCHQGKNPPVVKAGICFGCHDVWKHAFQHGPVAAGECLFCHDPHGSTEPKLVRLEATKQCTTCHSQPSSQEHIKSGKNKECTACHDPHGGSKKYFLKK